MATTKKTCAKKTAGTKKTATKKTTKKNDKLNITADDLPFKIVEPKLKVDPNSGLVEQVFEEDEKVDPEKQLWGKNADRTHAFRDLWFDDLLQALKDNKIPPNAQKEVAFMMLSNSLLDFIMDSVPTNVAMDLSYSLDHMIGMSLVNKKYDCDLMEEEEKAMAQVKRKDYDTDDDYHRALEAIQEHWWTLGQPKLDMRSPDDAIYETMKKYGLNE